MTRPMSEEREKLAEQLRFIAPNNNTVCWYGGPTQAATIIRQAADALLSTSAAVRGMRDALEKADHALTYAVIRMADDFLIEKLKATQKTVHAALSGIEPGEDEQARPSGSAPISTDTKGTTNG